MRMHARTLLVSSLVALSCTALAGTVNVSFVNAQNFTDAGNHFSDEEANLQAIARHVQGLGQRLLPANQVLKVEVLDVDLAGTVRPLFQGSGPSMRVLKGGADYPRIHLQYTLTADGKVLRSGKEWLADLDYSRGLTGERNWEALHYEKRMLDAWFRARFAEGAAANPG